MITPNVDAVSDLQKDSMSSWKCSGVLIVTSLGELIITSTGFLFTCNRDQNFLRCPANLWEKNQTTTIKSRCNRILQIIFRYFSKHLVAHLTNKGIDYIKWRYIWILVLVLIVKWIDQLFTERIHFVLECLLCNSLFQKFSLFWTNVIVIAWIIHTLS